MKQDVSDKVRGIVGLYNFYKYHMNTPQRIAILTLWIEVSVSKEEYEVANALQKEMDKILNVDEEYFAYPPSTMTFVPPNTDNVKEKILDIIHKERPKKKFKWINQWSSGTFELINISFNDTRFVLFNFGFEYS
jgi:hypothetical protein